MKIGTSPFYDEIHIVTAQYKAYDGFLSSVHVECKGGFRGGPIRPWPPHLIFTQKWPPPFLVIYLSWSEFELIILRKSDGNKLFIALYIKTTRNNWKEVICLKFSKPNLTKNVGGCVKGILTQKFF